MLINGYELNLDEPRLDKILDTQTRNIELIGRDFDKYQALPEGDKKALDHLLQAARIINDIALEQDHSLNLKLKKGLEEASSQSTHAAKALALFNSLNGVCGHNGLDKDPICIFKDVSLLPGKNFYPIDLSVAEFHEIIIRMADRGKFEELKKILSARTMVRRQGDELVAIDYTQYFAPQFSKIANELEVAAHYCSDPAFKDFLGWQAQALLQNNPEMDELADKHWAVLQDSPLEFTISRENYEDEMTSTVFDNHEVISIIAHHSIPVVSKDTLGCRVGIVNREETDKILVSKKTLPHLARWMPFNDCYEQHNVDEKHLKQTMADVDLIALTGDYAMCRGGIVTAQNLPNSDKDSVRHGGGRRNVYHRQVRFSIDKEREQRLLEKLVAPELHPYVDQCMSMIFVVGHENGHSLGPDSSFKDALGMYKHIIEEHKADVVSIASVSEIARKFELFDDEYIKKIYVSWVVGNLFLRARPVLSKPHRVADLIEFNYLLEHGVLWFDAEQKLHINFDHFGDVAYQLLQETIKVQLSKSVEAARDFINRWAVWGEISEYIAQVQQSLGVKPYIKIITKF